MFSSFVKFWRNDESLSFKPDGNFKTIFEWYYFITLFKLLIHNYSIYENISVQCILDFN